MYKQIKRVRGALLLACMLTLYSQSFAGLRLPAVFSDNMILQQKARVRIWGASDPNKTIAVSVPWIRKPVITRANAEGDWRVFLETPSAGGPYTMTIRDNKNKIELRNVLIGEVWFCSGQSNMEIKMNGYFNQPVIDANRHLLDADNASIRLFNVQKASSDKPLADCKGNWVVSNSSTAGDFSAVAWMYANILQQKLKVPVGIILSCWGGTRIQTWMSANSLDGIAASVKKQPAASSKLDSYGYGSLYNAMIAPVVGYGIKGFLWYQGEANLTEYAVYPELMKRMVADWRSGWNMGELPFYYVQIAPYHYPDKPQFDLLQPLMREAQARAMDEISGSGMVVTLDIGDYQSIHSPYKYEVALRLAYWALNRQYGYGGLACASPVYASHQIKDSKVYVRLKNAPYGISSYGKPITLFEVAGKDHVFYPAKATITRNEGIEVWSDEVPEPVAVRYGFKDYVKGELYSNAGLPLTSFRTDDWGLDPKAPAR